MRKVITASGAVTFSGSGYAPEGEVGREGGGTVDGALALELERALAAADTSDVGVAHPVLMK